MSYVEKKIAFLVDIFVIFLKQSLMLRKLFKKDIFFSKLTNFNLIYNLITWLVFIFQ